MPHCAFIGAMSHLHCRQSCASVVFAVVALNCVDAQSSSGVYALRLASARSPQCYSKHTKPKGLYRPRMPQSSLRFLVQESSTHQPTASASFLSLLPVESGSCSTPAPSSPPRPCCPSLHLAPSPCPEGSPPAAHQSVSTISLHPTVNAPCR
jgi:hypothetical protein